MAQSETVLRLCLSTERVVLCDRCPLRVNHTPEEAEKERVDAGEVALRKGHRERVWGRPFEGKNG